MYRPHKFGPLTKISQRSHRTTAVVAQAGGNKLRSVVTGAGGRTGGLVFKKLLEKSEEYEAVGAFRTEKSAKKAKDQYRAPENSLFVGDILKDDTILAEALKDAHYLIICTSAVPKIKPFSIIPVILAKIFKKEGVRPKFTFKENQMPEQIDWYGQKKQIDAAKAAGVSKVVLVGSMGGTDRCNFLNTIGDGDILVWKRRAEKYLIDSGLDYTIIHPGGLKDDEGGQRELIIDVDDNLISSKSKYRSIPRADVAQLCIECLKLGSRRAIDVVAKDAGDGQPTTDFGALLENMDKNCCYDDMKDDEVLKTQQKQLA